LCGHHLHLLCLLLVFPLPMRLDMGLKDLLGDGAQLLVSGCLLEVLVARDVSLIIVIRVDRQHLALGKALVLAVDLLLILGKIIDETIKSTDIPNPEGSERGSCPATADLTARRT
jgi:hypothetical protein